MATTADPPPSGLDPDGALRSLRLLIRPPVAADADQIHNLVNDWGVVRNLSSIPFPYPRTLAAEWIGSLAGEAAQGRAHHFAIVADGIGRDGGARVIGCVGLRLDAGAGAGELGYWIGRPYWRRGFAREAVSRVASWAMANLALDRLVASVAFDNEPSARLLEGLGFRREGRATRLFEARGGEIAVDRFAAGREDLWRAAGGRPAPVAGALPAPGPAPGPGASPPLLLVAACALIDDAGRVLLARRPEGRRLAGLWEFPGGKIEPGETPERALAREIREELGVEIEPGCAAPFAFASHDYGDLHLLMPLFVCRSWRGTPTGREGQALAWVRPDAIGNYPMTPAGRPLGPMLAALL